MVMYANEVETNEKQKITWDKKVTTTYMYCRPFASKAVFWAILKDFEFAIDSVYLTSICIHSKWFITISEAKGKSSTFAIK